MESSKFIDFAKRNQTAAASTPTPANAGYDPIGRYKSAQDATATAQSRALDAAMSPRDLSVRGTPGVSELVSYGRAKRAEETAKFGADMFNIKLGGVNRQLAQGINARNQEAALQDVEAQNEAARTTQTAEVDDGPVAQGQADTATAGGTSGRRRRNIIETGSIRI